MTAKRTSTVANTGVAQYCAPCVKRLNKGLVKNGQSAIPVRPCLRGEHFACFGCGELFDGTVVA